MAIKLFKPTVPPDAWGQWPYGDEPDNYYGCEACAWSASSAAENDGGEESDYYDPCGGGKGPFSANTNCAYHAQWVSDGMPLFFGGVAMPLGDPDVSGAVKWGDGGYGTAWALTQGCEACNWYNSVHKPGMMGPCGNGGMGKVPKSDNYGGWNCAAAVDWHANGNPMFPFGGEAWKPEPIDKAALPADKGCQACLWNAYKTGAVSDLCGHGDVDSPNPGCFYFTSYITESGMSFGDAALLTQQWKQKAAASLKKSSGGDEAEPHNVKVKKTKGELRREKSLSAFRLLDDVSYHSFKSEWKVQTDEQTIGTKFGLDVQLDLAQSCASFYVLERLHSDLWEYVGGDRVLIDGVYRRVGGGWMPRDHHMDGRKLMRAYEVDKAFTALCDKLAQQFSVYLQVACGGEFRHFAHKGNPAETPKLFHCKHECDGTCCTHLCELWPDEHMELLECGCLCKHEHTCDLAGCDVDECCGHICEMGPCWEYEKAKAVVNDRLQKYLDTMAASSGGRTTGWKHWRQLSKRNPAVWMQDVARGFLEGGWSGGYGGIPWGQAADTCAAYLRNDMQRRTFIDRCWTMQHHGGHIFNKFYNIDGLQKRGTNSPHPFSSDYVDPASGETMYRLDYVLNLQAKSEYDELAKFSAHEFLWNEHKRESERDAAKSAWVARLTSDRREPAVA